MYTIETLYHLQRRLGIEPGAEDARLLAALQAASAQIERLTGRRFCPRAATIEHSINPRQRTELLLDDDLLQLEALVSDGDAAPLENVLTLPDGDGPAGALRLTSGRVFTWSETPIRSAAVTGIWGWHDDWPRAWKASGDELQAAIDAETTMLPVADADGADAEGESPRFQVGHLLRIGAEYVRVLAVTVEPEGDDTLTVLRGVQGTTAAAHDPGAEIDSYRPAPDVAMLALRWAAWLYREPDSRAAGGIPPGLMRALDGLRRVGAKS
jgi:hypothetical protein